MEPGSESDIEYSVRNGRAEVVLNRPRALNAFTPSMLEELTEVLDSAVEDDDVYVIVLSGNGRGFCSGADVSGMEGREDRERRYRYARHLRKIQQVVRLLYLGPKPTVAAINGPAVGAGADFALACDLRVMSEEAYLREQFVTIGLVPGDGGGWLLPRLVGESRAKQYLLTGRDITVSDALRDGLAVEVVEPDDVLDAGRQLADELARKPALAMQNTKALVDVSRSFEEYGQAAFERQWACINDTEHTAAVNALLNGEDPGIDRT